MSVIKLVQRIRETAKALQTARDVGNADDVEELEDVLYELQEQLESEQRDSYSDRVPLE